MVGKLTPHSTSGYRGWPGTDQKQVEILIESLNLESVRRKNRFIRSIFRTVSPVFRISLFPVSHPMPHASNASRVSLAYAKKSLHNRHRISISIPNRNTVGNQNTTIADKPCDSFRNFPWQNLHVKQNEDFVVI